MFIYIYIYIIGQTMSIMFNMTNNCVVIIYYHIIKYNHIYCHVVLKMVVIKKMIMIEVQI
jgi:hypothetical protein